MGQIPFSGGSINALVMDGDAGKQAFGDHAGTLADEADSLRVGVHGAQIGVKQLQPVAEMRLLQSGNGDDNASYPVIMKPYSREDLSVEIRRVLDT